MFMKNFSQWRSWVILSSVMLALGFISSPAQGQEHIISYDTNVRVFSDATMLVTENIKVNANGIKIKRGIYRDFPTRYKDRLGNNYIVDFSIVSIKRDGLSEPYHIQNLSNGKRIYIGEASTFLSPGEYRYTIVYKTDRQLGYFKDHDELYWNVTGTDWAFPILKASAEIELPPQAKENIIETIAYTGRYGSKTQDVNIIKNLYGNPVFETIRTLMPGEGLTIVVSWPKGYVLEPTVLMKWQYFIKDNFIALFILLSFLGVIIYYLFIWFLLGRDPKKGTIIPLFHPPEGISPAAARFLMRMSFDNKIFSSAIINMAVKGYLVIKEKERKGIFDIFDGVSKKYILKKIGTTEDTLTPGERKAANKLFRTSDSIELIETNYAAIDDARDELEKELSQELENIYFISNKGYFLIGLGFSIGLGCLGIWLMIQMQIGIWFMFAMIGLMIFNLIFYHLLKAPTFKGRKILDKLEGFKMFLCVSEKEYLNLLNPPEKTPVLYSKYLPYALALDVEQKWAEQFTQTFEALKARGENYYPGWYIASAGHNFSVKEFSQNMGSSFAAVVASSATPPGSSSGGGGGGGGGGGFSGGGGGGGGGGGW